MNRRRFLSMLGAIPAALALPSLPALSATAKPGGVSIVVQSPMNDFRSDLQSAGVVAGGPVGSPQLVFAHGGETILPTPKPRTVVERAEARRVAEAVIRVNQAYLALASSPVGIELLAALNELETLQTPRRTT